MTGSVFPLTLDTKVSDTPCATGFDTRPLVERLGPDATWRTVFITEDDVLRDIPGYGPNTVDDIRRFISQNIPYSFQEFLESL